VNGLKRLPERPLLPQIRRSRTHIEMTGVRPTEASKAAVCYVRNTSTPAVHGANNWGVIQFDEEGRVIPTWEDDGDAA
jgi:hypothetical protein